MKIDLMEFDKHNMWLNEAGELSVRPGWHQYGQFGAIAYGKGCVSVENPNTGEPTYYVLYNNTNGRLNVYMKDIGAGGSDSYDQRLDFARLPNETQLTVADVDGEMVLAAPGMPTMWGYTGGPVQQAQKRQSPAMEKAGISALDIPSGLCTAWADRCVIASGRTIYISEAFYPQSFSPDNVLAVDGRVYALHVSPNGSLIICTNNGVWSFSADAAASGTVVGFLEKVSDYGVSRYCQTAITGNGLYGITRRGVRRIDTMDQSEININDRRFPFSLEQRISSEDYRKHARLFATEFGLCVSYASPIPGVMVSYTAANTGALCMIDLRNGFKSWWYEQDDNGYELAFNCIAVVKDKYGSDIFCVGNPSGTYFCSIYGNADGIDVSARGNDIQGYMVGSVLIGTEESPVLRSVTFSTDGASLVKCAVNGVSAVNTDQNGEATSPVIGTATWGSGTYGTRKLKSREFDFAVRSDDIVIEVKTYYSGTRFSRDCHLKISGFDKRRP